MADTTRVTREDLAFAASWIDGYEAGPDDEENAKSAPRVSAWLRAEIARRDRDALARSIARDNGVSVNDPRVKAAVRAATRTPARDA